MKKSGLALLILALFTPALAAVTARPNRAPIVQSPLRKAITPRVNRKISPPARPIALPASKIPPQAIVPPRPVQLKSSPKPTLSDTVRWQFYSYP
jgi:hypothetical protein